jgi:hypothetical protein
VEPIAEPDEIDVLVAEAREVSSGRLAAALVIAAHLAARHRFAPSDLTSPGGPNSNAPTDLLYAEWNQCGGHEILFSACLDRMGLRSRRVGFKGVPMHEGHVATEVEVDGQWHLIDSHFGICFSSLHNEVPLSLSEMRLAFPNIRQMRALPGAGLGRIFALQQCGFSPVEPAKEEILNPVSGKIQAWVTPTFVTSRSIGAGCRSHDEVLLWLDVSSDEFVSYGEPGGQAQKLAAPWRYADNVMYPALVERLGMFDHGNVMHRLMIRAPNGTRVDLEIELFENHSAADVLFHVEALGKPDGGGPEALDELPWTVMHPEGHMARCTFTAWAPITFVEVSLPWGLSRSVTDYRVRLAA